MTETLPIPRARPLHPTVVLALAASVAFGCEKQPVATDEPPTLSILSPSDGEEFEQGEAITFSAVAEDPEDGPLTGSSLGWFSSIDRQLGTGTPLVRNDLSTGTHEIRLTVVDSEQNVRNAFVTITVLPPNQPPTALIEAPTDGESFEEGASVGFSGSATDPEDGALTGDALAWTSSLDGPLGTGASLQHEGLSVGTHDIRLTATDSRGDAAEDEVSITIVPNDPPVAAILSPGDGQLFSPGQTVSFEGSADDPQEGALGGGALAWSSSLDGALGTGGTFQRNDLSEGEHEITLTATDALGATGTDQVTITVANLPPAAEIDSPASGAVFVLGEPVAFSGSAEDPEDGPLAGGALVWTSSLDGALGTGGAFQRSDLSEGDHTVTLTATDGEGATGTATVSITVSAEVQHPTATITSPADGASFEIGEAVTFDGSATDPQDGPLAGGALEWASSLDGPLGTGTGFARSDLSEGMHTISLTATDGDGRTGSAQVDVTVAPPNVAPTAQILSPNDGQLFQLGETVTFQGSGSDPEEGSLGGSELVWTSSLDGFLGTGISFQRSTLSAGTHEITLTATDSHGASASVFVNLIINAPPSATFLSPTHGATFDFGESITFNGSGADPEDGPRTPSWTSSRDGFLGVGVFSRSNLTAGVHVITMTVTDTDGGTASVQRTITVREPLSFRDDILPMFSNSTFRVAAGSCTDCHFDGGQDPEFGDPNANVPHTQLLSGAWNPDATQGRVVAGDDTRGDLLCKITDGSIPGTDGDSCTITGDDMRMIQTAIDRIRLWIRQGALNN